MFLPLLLGTLEIRVLFTTHTPDENSVITTDLPSQQLILTPSELWGNENKPAFPTSNCGASGVSALQLGPRGVCSMHFFSHLLRNSKEREPVFVTNTISRQAVSYLCLHLFNELFQKTFCDHMYLEPSQEVWFSQWHRDTLYTYTNSFSSLTFQAPFPQHHLQSLEWILSSLFPRGLKDSSYFLSFSLLQHCPWRVSFHCFNTVLQRTT